MAKMMDENDSYLKKGMKDEPETPLNRVQASLKRAQARKAGKSKKKVDYGYAVVTKGGAFDKNQNSLSRKMAEQEKRRVEKLMTPAERAKARGKMVSKIPKSPTN